MNWSDDPDDDKDPKAEDSPRRVEPSFGRERRLTPGAKPVSPVEPPLPYSRSDAEPAPEAPPERPNPLKEMLKPHLEELTATVEQSVRREVSKSLSDRVPLPEDEAGMAPPAAQPSDPRPARAVSDERRSPPPKAQKQPRRRREDAPSLLDPPAPTLVAENAGLEVRSLGKTYKKRPILRDVSLKVQRGEAVGLLGPNGAGKTTCFYMISGLIPADFGEISLDGNDITELPMYRRARMGIGYLPQEASIFRGLTVEQNIRAVLEVIEKKRDRREATLEALLAEFSITHLRRTPAIALSGGERRRLEIARALASQPHFILLDEPLAGIDPIAVRDIRELVSHLKDRGIGVLITDHNVRETLDIVDRAYILHDGRVLMEGTPEEIVTNQEVRRVYLGDRFSL